MRWILCKVGLHDWKWRSSGQWYEKYSCERCGKIDKTDNARALNCDHKYRTLAGTGRTLEQKCSKCGKPCLKNQEPRWPF